MELPLAVLLVAIGIVAGYNICELKHAIRKHGAPRHRHHEDKDSASQGAGTPVG